MPELGYPALVTGAWTALMEPKATPKDVVARLNAAVNEALQQPSMIETFTRLGAQARGGGPRSARRCDQGRHRKMGADRCGAGLQED